MSERYLRQGKAGEFVVSGEAKALLDATIAVRKAIDRHCVNGVYTSEMPDYSRIKHIFDVLHKREERAWERMKRNSNRLDSLPKAHGAGRSIERRTMDKGNSK